MPERLQKILAASGVGSRRECERLIADGRVTVNGKTVSEVGSKADAEKDVIAVDGNIIASAPQVYVALNKPRGYTSTKSDPHAPRTVMELLPAELHSLHIVGRLDGSSEGLMLLTNDGALSNRIMHPRYQMPKTYRATIDGLVDYNALRPLQKGVQLEDGMTRPADVEIVALDRKLKRTRVEITIREGRNRQVRRMFEHIGYNTLRLVRQSIGPVRLEKLPVGQWRHLTKDEVAALRTFNQTPTQPKDEAEKASYRRPSTARSDSADKRVQRPERSKGNNRRQTRP